jgi:protein gp37
MTYTSNFKTTKNYSPWVGCVKYSEGCKNCFARAVMDGETLHRSDTFYDLLDKTKYPPGTNVYQCLNSDFWLPWADQWRGEVWEMMRERSDLSYILMTKRVYRVASGLPEWVREADNIGFVTTMEDQNAATVRAPYTWILPFKNKLITVGPIKEYVNLNKILPAICQVFVLGEMGQEDQVVPCDYKWVKKIKEDCEKHDTNFDLLMAGSVFIDDKGRRRVLKGFNEMMGIADEYELHYKSKTKRQYHHEPSLVFEGK